MNTPDANDTYLGLRAVLERYIQPDSVTASLDSVLPKLGLTPADLGTEQVPDLVAEAMLGLRLFCDSAALPELMVDLAEYCDAPPGAPGGRE